jgi:hypothetical protein
VATTVAGMMNTLSMRRKRGQKRKNLLASAIIKNSMTLFLNRDHIALYFFTIDWMLNLHLG